MEYTISTNNIEDAEDLFIVAKERLLDINDWHSDYGFILTDSNQHKVQRNAHKGDFITKSSLPNEKYIINKIQYDDYPDIAGESITIFMADVNDVETMQSVSINRVGKLLTVLGHNLDFVGNATDFLKGLITSNEYAIAS
jgi:hypothetical protein